MYRNLHQSCFFFNSADDMTIIMLKHGEKFTAPVHTANHAIQKTLARTEHFFAIKNMLIPNITCSEILIAHVNFSNTKNFNKLSLLGNKYIWYLFHHL